MCRVTLRPQRTASWLATTLALAQYGVDYPCATRCPRASWRDRGVAMLGRLTFAGLVWRTSRSVRRGPSDGLVRRHGGRLRLPCDPVQGRHGHGVAHHRRPPSTQCVPSARPVLARSALIESGLRGPDRFSARTRAHPRQSSDGATRRSRFTEAARHACRRLVALCAEWLCRRIIGARSRCGRCA